MASGIQLTYSATCPCSCRVIVWVSADAGVWRSHASSMQLPLQQPVNITATALQLPSGAVAVNATLSLDPSLRSTFVLHQAGLRPQFGLVLGPGFSSSGVLQGSSSSEGLGSSSSSRIGFSEAVPLVLVPGGAAGLSFLLLPDQGEPDFWLKMAGNHFLYTASHGRDIAAYDQGVCAALAYCCDICNECFGTARQLAGEPAQYGQKSKEPNSTNIMDFESVLGTKATIVMICW